MKLIRDGYPMYCAHFPGGDPWRFEPDIDCALPEEVLAWKEACASWRGEPLDSAMVILPGGGWLYRGMFGPGTYWYAEDWFSDEPHFDGIETR